MALSAELKQRIRIAVSDKDTGEELIAAIEAGSNQQAANVAALGTTTNLVGVDGVGSNAAPLAGTEARLDAAEGKIDAVIAALKASGQMASS